MATEDVFTTLPERLWLWGTSKKEESGLTCSCCSRRAHHIASKSSTFILTELLLRKDSRVNLCCRYYYIVALKQKEDQTICSKKKKSPQKNLYFGGRSKVSPSNDSVTLWFAHWPAKGDVCYVLSDPTALQVVSSSLLGDLLPFWLPHYCASENIS